MDVVLDVLDVLEAELEVLEVRFTGDDVDFVLISPRVLPRRLKLCDMDIMGDDWTVIGLYDCIGG